MPTVAVNGVSLFYLERGRGDPVLMVHGGLGDYRDWDALLSLCSREYRGIAYSRRNAHPNPLLPASVPSAAADHAVDLIELITSLGAAPAHIVADSYGAAVALLAALRAPRLVRTLVLDEPPVPSVLGSDARDPKAVEEFLAALREDVLEAFDGERPEAAVQGLIDYLEGAATWAGLPPAARREILGNADALQRELRGGFPVIGRAELGGLTVPALLIRGDKGPDLLHRCTEALADSMPRSRLVTLPGLTHGALPQSEAYRTEVLGFIRAHSGPPSGGRPSAFRVS